MTHVGPEDLAWLDRAVALAAPFLGTTSDNPTAAAILVDRAGQEISHAITASGGRPHAETLALEQAGPRASGSTLYVTLEPCSHWGRTPPCADAVVRAGVARVVIGIRDPDPRSSGKGSRRLAASGLDVVVADHAGSRRLHEGHIMRMRRGRPFVIAAMAISSDGRIGLPDRGGCPVLGPQAREWLHRQRATVDAAMIGSGTARVDNPSLTVAIPGLEKRTPRRVILVGNTPLDRSIDLIGKVSPFPVTVIVSEGAPFDLPPAVEILEVKGREGRPILQEALKALAARGIARLLVEAGAIVTERLLVGELIDRFHLLQSPVEVGPRGIPATRLGTMQARLDAAGFVTTDRQAIGDDQLITYERRSRGANRGGQPT